MPDRDLIERHARPERIALIAQSHAALTGKALVARCDGDVADALWHLPAVVLAHGIEDDPVFFYANRAALDRFALTGRALMAMPSRLSAEAPERGGARKVAGPGGRKRVHRRLFWRAHRRDRTAIPHRPRDGVEPDRRGGAPARSSRDLCRMDRPLT